jgi:alpha-tubulin suppressor-like RCC1 family protein
MPAHLSRLVPLVLLAVAAGCREDPVAPDSSERPSALGTAASAPLPFRRIDGGCGITTDDAAWCWGPNGSGRVGDGTTETRLVPARVLGGLAFRQISARSSHTCGVTTGDMAYCWGANYIGQLGDGTTEDRWSPVPVSGGLRFKQVDTAGELTCGVTTQNRVYCWGGNTYGTLGNGTTEHSSTPVPVAGGRRFRQVAVGGLSACAINLNDVPFCWGDNSGGQLGDGSDEPRLVPVRVDVGDLRFRQVSIDFLHACGVATTGSAYCWGANEYGRLGNGTFNQSSPTPDKVRGGVRFSSVSAAAYHTCGVATTGVAYCWGFGSYLGGTPVAPSRLPLPVSGGLLWRRVQAGYASCGVTIDKLGYCWGFGAGGELGNGATDFSTTPVPIAPPE